MHDKSRSSSVGIVIVLQTRQPSNQDSIPGRDTSYPLHSRDVKPTTHLRPALKLKNTRNRVLVARCLIKHTENFAFCHNVY
jgi:hypothetical protein